MDTFRYHNTFSMRYSLFLTALFAFCACGSSDKINSLSVFSPSVLPVQEYTINNEKDTLLKTRHGSRILISKGSFDTKEPVRLVIKEAISPAEIFAAGMITESNGRPLGSGGMIYINTLEKGIALLKPLKISIPTNSFEPAMQVFKGVETDSGRINWTDPQPLDSTPLQNDMANAKAIFRGKCMACHTIFTKMTGPQLAGLEDRGPWKDRQQLFRWINNPARFMSTNSYTQGLKREYGSMMTGFADLTQRDVNAIADYIKSETVRPGAFEEALLYRRSGRNIDTLSGSITGDIRNFNDSAATTLYPDSNNCTPSTVYLPVPPPEPAFLEIDTAVKPTKAPVAAEAMGNKENIPDTDSIYYEFNIDTLGWHNVDFFLDGFPGTWNTQVRVTISNQDQTGPVVLTLFSPRNKMLMEAENEGENNYRFNKVENGIPLFLQDRAILLAYTSKDKKIYYAIKEFTVQKVQSFEMALRESTESDILKAMKEKKIDNAGLDLSIPEKRVIYRECGDTVAVGDTLRK
jgi:mono/diheme cytochrome c family protein